MTFAHPAVLFALPLVVALSVAWFVAAGRAHRRAKALTRRRAPRASYLAGTLLTLAALASVFAAAAPRWGSESLELPREGADVIFIVDVSRSMAAADVGTSRLSAARQAIDATIAGLDGDRVGLVIFGGTGYLRMPPTTDLDAAREVVASLDAGAIFVEPGSSIAQGLAAAARLPLPADPGVGRVFVLVSDGDDIGVDPLDLATQIGAVDIDVIVAGVGTPGGATIPVFDPGSRETTDKLDSAGEPLITHLNEALLLSVARAADGRYLGDDLALLPGAVQGRLATLRDTRVDERTTEVPVERFQLFAGLALAFVVLAIAVEKLPSRGRSTDRRALPLAGVLSVLCALLAGCTVEGDEANDRGHEAFALGDYREAARQFELARTEEPREFQLSLNLALALYAVGDHEGALIAASRAAESARPELRGAANATSGHVLFSAGNLPAALEAFEEALRADPQPSYRHDYEVVLRLLQPPPEPTPTPDPSASPQPGEIPTTGDPGGTPSTSGTPGPGDPSATPPGGTPQPGDPGGELPDSITEANDRIAEIDQQIALLLPQAGEEIDREDAIEILDLLAERARLAGLRESLGGGGDPRDY